MKGMTETKIIVAAITPTQNVIMTTEETTDGIRTSSQGEEIMTNIIVGMTTREDHTENGTTISNRDLFPDKNHLRDLLFTRAKTSKGLKLNKEAKIKMLVTLNTR